MSLVPLMFRDWWDDLERPSRLLDQHFGLGLRHQDLLNYWPTLRSTGYMRPWRSLARQDSGSSNVVVDKDKFQVILDVQQFAPSEISVKTVDDKTIVVEGKHEEKQDEHGYISRHFVRRYLLPPSVNAADVISNLSSDGVLTITAPKREALPAGERVVPIQQTGAPAVKPAADPTIPATAVQSTNTEQSK
uniref:Protein lethal2 essential for life n=1 Tax=Teleogryllus emma TaxID=62746 RepID=A0A6G7GXN3_9ORTH|nr:protein lethal2 essential for life [Teleogryllus emma]